MFNIQISKSIIRFVAITLIVSSLLSVAMPAFAFSNDDGDPGTCNTSDVTGRIRNDDTATITNISNRNCTVGYAVFLVPKGGSLSDQTLFDNQSRDIRPGQSVDFTLDIPKACDNLYQLDLYAGNFPGSAHFSADHLEDAAFRQCVGSDNDIPAPTADIKANASDGPITIPANTSADISWNSTNANNCSVTPGNWTGTYGQRPSGNLTATQTYTVTCTGNGKTATDSVTVNVTAAPQCVAPTVTTLTATNVGQNSATISGTVVTNTQSATVRLEYGTNPSSFGTVLATQTIAANTTQTITANLTGLQANTTYYFRIVGDSTCGNQVTGTTLNFTTGVTNTSITADIRANNQDGTVTVPYNTAANITWTSTGATQCTVQPNGWTGTQETSGRSTGNITGTITYTLICTNTAGQQAVDTVTVTPTGNINLPTVTLTPNPSVINLGQSSVLTWYSTNATQCYASGGPWSGNKAIPSGSETVSPTITTTYTITCSNQYGTAQANATVIVNNNQAGTTIQVVKLVRNITLNQTAFQQTVEAQGLDQLEFEIRVRNTENTFRTITVQDILPQELFYVTGSTSVNGQTSQDGITAGGLTLSFAPNEEKVIRFRTTVFSGVSQRTITNQATASGQNGGYGAGFANVDLRNRGTVLGVSDIATGPEDTMVYAIGIGLILSMILFAVLKRTGLIDGQVRRAKRGIEDVLFELQKKAQVTHEASRAFRNPSN